MKTSFFTLDRIVKQPNSMIAESMERVSTMEVDQIAVHSSDNCTLISIGGRTAQRIGDEVNQTRFFTIEVDDSEALFSGTETQVTIQYNTLEKVTALRDKQVVSKLVNTSGKFEWCEWMYALPNDPADADKGMLYFEQSGDDFLSMELRLTKGDWERLQSLLKSNESMALAS